MNPVAMYAVAKAVQRDRLDQAARRRLLLEARAGRVPVSAEVIELPPPTASRPETKRAS